MITNANDSSLIINEEDIIEEGENLTGLSSVDEIIGNLQKRRENVLNGGVNCIPFPFPRFRQEVPGIEQGQYVVLTANAKVGKTMVFSYMYLFNALDYAFEHPERCSIHVIYFALEESVQKITERYMSHLLWELDGIRISPSDLRSTSLDYPVPKDILEKFDTEKYRKRLDFFEKCVQFDTENTNPTGILRVCEAYAKSVGVYKSHKELSGNLSKEVSVFDSYVQNDPNHYKIVVIDHIGLVDKEQGFKTKDSIDKTSEYFVKYLRNRYNYTCIAIQQQAFDSEGLEAIKQKKMLPSAATLGDSKYTSRDADLVLGLFDPSKFGLPSWLGYTIQDTEGTGLRGYGRFLYVIANRNGEMGGVCPLFFDGATCTFEELPRPEDVDAMAKYYRKAKTLKTWRQQRKSESLMLVTLLNKMLYGK